MSSFKKYYRKNLAEMRPVTKEIELSVGNELVNGRFKLNSGILVSVSNEDFKNGSPKVGDMIARNPENHEDQWLVSEDYFNKNFTEK